MNSLRSKNAQVLSDQEAMDELPLTLQPGDRVQVGRSHPERAEFVWASDGGMCSGWVPLVVLAREGGFAKATREFCSQLLPVKRGDRVRVFWHGEGHDDWWCENRDGDRGWLPASALVIEASEIDNS